MSPAHVLSEVPWPCLDAERTHLELEVLILSRLGHCSTAVGGCPRAAQPHIGHMLPLALPVNEGLPHEGQAHALQRGNSQSSALTERLAHVSCTASRQDLQHEGQAHTLRLTRLVYRQAAMQQAGRCRATLVQPVPHDGQAHPGGAHSLPLQLS